MTEHCVAREESPQCPHEAIQATCGLPCGCSCAACAALRPVTTWTLELPWTRPPLSLNDRGQTPGARAARSAKAAEIKTAVTWLARANVERGQTAIHVRLHYQPKDKRRRDPDNLVATLKPCIDGLVAAGIVPDDCPSYVDWSAPRIHPPADDRKARMWLEVTA